MRSIRGKIILLCVLVVLVPVLVLNHYSIRTFSRFSGPDLEEHMIDSAFLVGEEYKAALGTNADLDSDQAARWSDAVHAYAREIEARIQVLSTGGLVRIDSAPEAETNADRSSLPEVVSALKGKYRARSSLTPDRRYMFYHVAYPVAATDRVCGVVYVSRNTSSIVRTINRMIRFQRITTASAILLGVALAAVLATSITRRLRRLTAAAAAFAAGGAPVDVRVGGRDEIAELAGAIREMVAEIQRTNRYNRDFVAEVMHELNMPITAIGATAEALEHRAFANDEERAAFWRNIHFGLARLDRLVGELRELTKLDADISHAPKEKVDYGACVRDIVDRVALTLDPGHAPIEVAVPGTRVFANVIPARIEQVVGNLLDNAARYTPASGRIEVRVEPRPDRTVITSVRDTGCGIAASNVGKVFDRFFSTEPKGEPRDYGSGLGLAIARTIVENHHGRIWVESVPGQGATFFFSLPIADA